MKDGYLMHGGDYNPEQWLDMPEVFDTDIERFLEAKINTVTLGVFSWSKLEPKDGEYHFEWLEAIIDRLYANGIGVILSTPSAARPHWLADRYPEVLRVNEKREKMLFGTRHNHCPTSPAYREKVRQIDTRLAARFGAHPAVKMWHISNEFSGECHCPLCQKAFQGWLEKKYGNIAALNDSWCTAFWSHTYDSFSQVESPSSLGERSVMGLILDWKRFVSDQIIDFMEQEIAAIRSAGSDKPAAVNMMYYFDGVDYFKMARRVDVVSWDNYPAWDKRERKETAQRTAFWHDVIRSLKKQPFLMMESCPGATNWQGVSRLKRPGLVRAASLQSIAHGADGALYFQMRKSRGGEEKFHGAVLDHYDGNDTRVFREVCGTGDMLAALGRTAGSQTRAEAAVLYDWDNIWAMEGSWGPRNEGMGRLSRDCAAGSYRALRRLGMNVDFVDQSCALEGYRLVAAPMQYLFHPGFAEKVRAFVEQGGTFVMTYWSGVVDENDLCFLGGTPHGLMDVFGLRSEELDALYDWEENEICRAEGKLPGMRERYPVKYFCDLVKPGAAETLMVYGKDFYAGQPALLRNAYGKGTAWYLCAGADQDFYDDLYRQLAKEAGLSGILPGEIPDGVEVTSRETEEERFIFVQNFSPETVSLTLPEGKTLFGRADGTLEPLEGLVLAVKK